MAMLRPTRTSSPARRLPLPQSHTQPSDLSRSSILSAVPELTGLTPEDVQIIDAIIERADPTASTFLPVFKVYNDVLTEHGLDPRETIYYGKLLKLGTLKGSNWGEKWRMVKIQNGYDTNAAVGLDVDPPKSEKALGKMRSTPLTRRPILRTPSPQPVSTLTNDLFSSINSHDTHSIDSDTPYQEEPSNMTTRPMNILQRQVPSPSDVTSNTNTLGLDLGDHPALSAPMTSHIPPVSRPYYSGRLFDHELSEPTAATSSPSLPSYRAAAQDRHVMRTPLANTRFLPTVGVGSAKPVIANDYKPPVRSTINEEEAWKKVRMLQDEKEADRFREEKLLERVFRLWKENYEWFETVLVQLDQARDETTLKYALQTWRRRTAEKTALYERVEDVANNRFLLKFYKKWKLRIKEKHAAQWRHDMRVKIHAVRKSRNEKLRKDAWAKWRQSYQSHLADQRYAEQLVVRLFRFWQGRIVQLKELKLVAEEASQTRIGTVAVDCWERWRLLADLRKREKVVAGRVDLRIMGETLTVFKKRMVQIYKAEAFYNVLVAKRAIRSWKAARDRIRALERRADKRIHREDHVLLQAVMRVWKARERGKLLQTVKASRLRRGAWTVWKSRLQEQRHLENVAIQFVQRSTSSTTVHALNTWTRAYATHLNSSLFADQYYSNRLLHRTVQFWYQKYLTQKAMMGKAKDLYDHHNLRRTWDLMRAKHGQRVRTAKLYEFEQRKLKRVLEFWIKRAQQEIQRRFAEETISHRVRQRILRTTLTHWTNRVIDMKVRELEVAQHSEMQILVGAFTKWKRIRSRHMEELSLMESYQEVRRQEHVRRLFHHWLNAARTSRNRRILLATQEEEMKLRTIAEAWDKWRERFKDERLRPLEHTFTVQSKEALKYRAWMTWLSKTKTLPAIHFHSNHVKARYWKVWLNAMPRALQSKKARENDKGNLLKKSFSKWTQAYRTKLALKAVARARYFPIPTPAPQPTPASRLFAPPISSAFRNLPALRTRQIGRSEEREEQTSPEPSEPRFRSRPLGVRAGLFPSPKARTESRAIH
ncbi:hypothetical protein K435DRAFT_751904 [Dendrothele bispora CBS 962.96]|uniref:Sfi1 spindle body domain-containing protein n=1 Tax=Dendrothele bispora (strain CBS 962.96) TaxID=1314807 RepID=A0A4S8MAS1_DENBC|nr:hypothetical protein K435DRAFT_751904 [Dendrothele bispora CBS 962.96]